MTPTDFDYVVVGAGAIGGTIGAMLARGGSSVLFCDADHDHVAAINAKGIMISGPIEELTLSAPAVLPEELPDKLGAVLLAVKHQHTADALAVIAPRLANDGYIVSLQNGMNEQTIAARVGADRTVGAFVNFGADYTGPGSIRYSARGSMYIGELDGRSTERVDRLVREIGRGAQATDNIFGFLWAKAAYAAMLTTIAVSGLSMADGLADPRYQRLYIDVATEVLSAADAQPEPFEGFDPSDLAASIQRMAEANRRSAKTHSGIYRDLAIRKRKAEPLLAGIDGPLIRRTLEIVHEIEAGRRLCEVANLELLAAYARIEDWEPRLNAVITTLSPGQRAQEGPLHGAIVAIKDNIDVRGIVATKGSEAGRSGPSAEDAAVVSRLRAAGADLLCTTNMLEYGAGSVHPAFGGTRHPVDQSRTAGGSSGGSAALVAAGVCDYALGTDSGGSIRVPAAYCGIVGIKPTYGLVPRDGVFPLSPSLGHVGTLTRTVAQGADLLAVISGVSMDREPVDGLRVGVLREQLDDPCLASELRTCVLAALDRLRALGFVLVDVEIPALAVAEQAFNVILVKEGYGIHREMLNREPDNYAEATRALLERGAEIDPQQYGAAMADRERVATAIGEVFQDVDVLVGPTVPWVAPSADPAIGSADGDAEGRFTVPYNHARCPAVSVPCGVTAKGLPIGLQLAAAMGNDALLLSAASAYQGESR